MESGVEHFNAAPYGGAPDGTMIVELANYVCSAGRLEQTVATVAGQTYDVSFWAGNIKSSSRRAPTTSW